jgi:hypothetical protein
MKDADCKRLCQRVAFPGTKYHPTSKLRVPGSNPGGVANNYGGFSHFIPKTASQKSSLGMGWEAPALALLFFLWLCTPIHAAPETCGQFKSCGRHFVAEGVCNGDDQLPILSPAWEDRPIRIRSVTVGLQIIGWRLRDVVRGFRPSGYIFAGNSYVPDIMALQLGPGATTNVLPSEIAFLLPGKGPNVDPHTHVDAHVSCSPGYSFRAWLIVYYDFQ